MGGEGRPGSRMYRNDKRDTCTGNVFGVTDDHGKVATKAAATR